MIVKHECLECGFVGEVIAINKKLTCPNCNTVNDVWLKGETPPLNHRRKEKLRIPPRGPFQLQKKIRSDFK